MESVGGTAIGIGVAVLAGLGIAFILGALIEAAKKKPHVQAPTSNPDLPDCVSRCKLVHDTAKELCTVRRAESRERDHAAQVWKDYWAAEAKAGSLLAAAAVAALVPFFGTLVAAGILIAAGVAQLIATGFLGAATIADGEVDKIVATRNVWAQRDHEARNAMLTLCGAEEYSRCAVLVPPCLP